MIRRAFVRSVLVVAALAALRPGWLVAQGPGITVYLVRHAEKGTTPAADPPLTPAGETRAAALAAALRDAGVTAAITTDLTRTKATAQPLADARKLTPIVVGVRVPTPQHVAAVADAVRNQAGGVVLVVGHSNTIPRIVEALGGPGLPDICDGMYSDLFIMRLDPGKPATVARVRYGAPDPDGADACAAMKR
jgi:phosphohistidine phosphatase SixA